MKTFILSIFGYLMVLSMNNVLAQAEQCPYDTTFYYTHQVNSPVPDSFLTGILVKTVNAQGFLAQSELMPWDTSSQTFQPVSSRYKVFYDAQGRDTLTENYWKVDGGLDLRLSKFSRYNAQGVKIYSETINKGVTNFTNPTRTISHYDSVGKVLTDTVWQSNASNPSFIWKLWKNTLYTYQGDLITHKLEYLWVGAGSHENIEEIYTYDSSGKVLEFLTNFWSSTLMQMRPFRRDVSTYHTPDEHQRQVHYRWSENDSVWNITGKDSTFQNSPQQKITITWNLDDTGNYQFFRRTTETETDTLRVFNRELFGQNGVWIPQQRNREYFDTNGNNLSKDYLSMKGPQGLDTMSYRSETYLYYPSGYLEFTIFDEYFPAENGIKRHYTHRYSLINFATSIDDRLALQTLIYPNPSNGRVNIELENSSKSSVEVLALNGQRILNKSYHSRFINLELEHLPQGIYILQVKQGEKVAIEKLVIEN